MRAPDEATLVNERHIRVLVVMEASTVSGPAKNLLAFSTLARDRYGVSVEIATFGRHPMIETPFTCAVRQTGIPLHVIPEKVRWDKSVFAALRQLVTARAPSLLQTHGVKSHFLMRWTGLATNVPWLAFNHGYTAEDVKQQLYNQLDRYSLRGATHIVAVCRPFACTLERWGINSARISVLANSIQAAPACEEVEIQRVRRQYSADGCRVLAVIGRLSREKGHAVLLDAVALVCANLVGPPLRVLIVGEGPERAKLEMQVQSRGLQEVVCFTGYQSRVGPFLAVADAFILPSFSEGSPNALLEAMAAGVPVVATAVGGVPDIVQHGRSGWLVSPGSAQALASAIKEILCHPDTTRTRALEAQRVISTHFTPEAYAAALVQLYHRLLASKGGL